MNRPKISVFIAASIDGYIANKEGSVDFLESVRAPHEDYGYKNFLESIDAIIMGRKTYETVLQASEWPYLRKRSVVLSHTLSSVNENALLFKGDINSLVTQLFHEGIKSIWVDGGVTIAQFLQLKIVDEMIVSIIPMLLGSGIPLFNKIEGCPLNCRLVASKSYSSGLVQVQYKFN